MVFFLPLWIVYLCKKSIETEIRTNSDLVYLYSQAEKVVAATTQRTKQQILKPSGNETNNTANRWCARAQLCRHMTEKNLLLILFVVNEKMFKAAHPHIFLKSITTMFTWDGVLSCVCVMWMLWIHSGGTAKPANGVHCNGHMNGHRSNIEETWDKQKTRFLRILFFFVFVLSIVRSFLLREHWFRWIYVFLS